MKTLSTILLFVTFFAFNTYAQNDSEAASLLESISKKYQKVSSYKLDVELSINIPEEEKDVTLFSTVWLKGDKYIIDFEEKIIQSNTISEWVYLKEVNELQIGNYDPLAMMFLPSKLFNLYSDDYLYRIKKTYKTKNGDLIKVIELTPTNKDFLFFKIVARVNTRTMEIIETQMFEKTGYKYAYKILAIDTTVNLTDSFFNFDIKKYNIDPDDITDLR